MAWVRTATSLISFGFTIFKFFEGLHAMGEPAQRSRLLGSRNFALIMIGIGLFALVAATIEHRRNMRTLETLYGTQPHSLAVMIAALVSVLGILGLVAVLLGQ